MPPLVVDFDGTLTPTDTLAESVVKLVKQSPWNLVRLAMLLPKGKAVFKCFVAANTTFSAATLPYREPLLHYLRNERGGGRRLILATASQRTIAEGVSAHLGIFDEVIATETMNLKGRNKLERAPITITGSPAKHLCQIFCLFFFVILECHKHTSIPKRFFTLVSNCGVRLISGTIINICFSIQLKLII